MKNVFGVYKPKGPTSNDVLRQIRKMTGEKKVGHAGTLDPLASGVLVVGVGRKGTRELGKIVQKEKEYVATIRLGEVSSTDDAEGEKIKIKKPEKPDKALVRQVLNQFKGEIRQVPPVFSAVKVRGREAYKLARAGKKVKLKPRRVNVKEIELLKYRWPYVKIRVRTGPGVYVRSIARDLGEGLGTGAYLAALERTRVGNFAIKDCVKIKLDKSFRKRKK